MYINDNNKKNYEYLFSLKMMILSNICAILVVFIHAYNIDTYNVNNSFTENFEIFISKFLGQIAVPFFFISSAFWTYSKKRKLRSFFKNKFRSLVIPYLLWNLFYMVFFAAFSYVGLANFEIPTNFYSIIEGLVLYKYNYAFWFMFHLIIFTLFYPIINKIIEKYNIAIMTLVCVFIVYTIIGNIPVGIYVIKSDALLYYLVGAILGRYYKQKLQYLCNNFKGKINVILSSFFISIILFYLKAVNNECLIIGRFMDVLSALFLIITVFLTIDYIIVKDIDKNILCYSFFVYCLHTLILESIEKMIYTILPKTDLIALMSYILSPIVTLFIIVLIGVVFKNKYVFKVLNGNR